MKTSVSRRRLFHGVVRVRVGAQERLELVWEKLPEAVHLDADREVLGLVLVDHLEDAINEGLALGGIVPRHRAADAPGAVVDLHPDRDHRGEVAITGEAEGDLDDPGDLLGIAALVAPVHIGADALARLGVAVVEGGPVVVIGIGVVAGHEPRDAEARPRWLGRRRRHGRALLSTVGRDLSGPGRGPWRLRRSRRTRLRAPRMRGGLR